MRMDMGLVQSLVRVKSRDWCYESWSDQIKINVEARLKWPEMRAREGCDVGSVCECIR